MSNGVTRTGKSGTAEEKVQEIAQKTSKLAGSYSNFTTKVAQLTGNIIKLPTASTRSPVANILTALGTSTDVMETLAASLNGGNVQISSVNPQGEAFKWVEFESVPGDFVSFDSVLLFAGEALYKDNGTGATFIPIGACQNFSMSSNINVTAIQELRCEEQIIIPGKLQPISISIGRLCGTWDNLLTRLHGNGKGWKYSLQYNGMRDLFGMLVMVLDTSRRNVITQFYIERCAIGSWSFALSAGQFQVIENVSLVAGRIIDPAQDVANEEALKAAEEAAAQEAYNAEHADEIAAELQAEQAAADAKNKQETLDSLEEKGVHVDANGNATVEVTDEFGNKSTRTVTVRDDGTIADANGNTVAMNSKGSFYEYEPSDMQNSSVQKAANNHAKAENKLAEKQAEQESSAARIPRLQNRAEEEKATAEYYENKANEEYAKGNYEKSKEYSDTASAARENQNYYIKEKAKEEKNQTKLQKAVEKAKTKVKETDIKQTDTLQKQSQKRAQEQKEAAQKAAEEAKAARVKAEAAARKATEEAAKKKT